MHKFEAKTKPPKATLSTKQGFMPAVPDNHLLERRSCSVRRTLEIFANRWNFLILREAFFGVRRFEGFQSNLRVARNILTDRLQMLTANGILERRRYSKHPNRFEYRLTEKGLDFFPIILALMRWGDRGLGGKAGPPLLLYHKKCGHLINPVLLCDKCGLEIKARDTRYENGSGGFFTRQDVVTRPKWRKHGLGKPDTRVCSVRRSLNIISDWWTFLVLREAFLGVRRFEDFRNNLGVARTILTNRLQMLTANGILERRRYSEHLKRFEYRLTEKGLDSFPVILTLMGWGDRWLAGKAGPPLLLYHKCGRLIVPIVTCAHCGLEIKARETRYEFGPSYHQPDLNR